MNTFIKSVILVMVLLLSGCYVRPIGVRHIVGVPNHTYRNPYYNNSFRHGFGYPRHHGGVRIYPYNYGYRPHHFGGYYQGGYQRRR